MAMSSILQSLNKTIFKVQGRYIIVLKYAILNFNNIINSDYGYHLRRALK